MDWVAIYIRYKILLYNAEDIDGSYVGRIISYKFILRPPSTANTCPVI